MADGMSKAAVAFMAKQLAAENTHSGQSHCLACHQCFGLALSPAVFPSGFPLGTNARGWCLEG